VISHEVDIEIFSSTRRMPPGAREMRLVKEKAMLERSPPAGVSCWIEDDKLDALRAEILGAKGKAGVRGGHSAGSLLSLD
jgi:hypothetical protein